MDQIRLLIEAKKYDEALELIELHLRAGDISYYELISTKINIFVLQNNINKALEILKDELSMPYIPSPYNKEFEELYTQLLRQSNKDEPLNKMDAISDEDLVKLMLSVEDEDELIYLFDQLGKRNIRKFMPLIKDLLKTKHSNKIKTILIELLKDQDVNEDLIVNHNGLEITLNPRDCDYLLSLCSIKLMSEKLDKINVDNETSFHNLSYYLLVNYVSDVYPLDIDDSEYDYIVGAIVSVFNRINNAKIECDFSLLNQKLLEEYINQINELVK